MLFLAALVLLAPASVEVNKTFAQVQPAGCPSSQDADVVYIGPPPFELYGQCKMVGKWDCSGPQFARTSCPSGQLAVKQVFEIYPNCCLKASPAPPPPSPPSPPPRWVHPSSDACRGDAYVFSPESFHRRTTDEWCRPLWARSGVPYPCPRSSNAYCAEASEGRYFSYKCVCFPGFEAVAVGGGRLSCRRCSNGYRPQFAALMNAEPSSAQPTPSAAAAPTPPDETVETVETDETPQACRERKSDKHHCHKIDRSQCANGSATGAQLRAECPHTCGLCASGAASELRDDTDSAEMGAQRASWGALAGVCMLVAVAVGLARGALWQRAACGAVAAYAVGDAADQASASGRHASVTTSGML
mmetsp:Transcript_931/g.2498  ORF Transcript_931/g.2498 Transcript_931/m.2498 type:complete len:359 (-) Transcript_931:321-1397(-)